MSEKKKLKTGTEEIVLNDNRRINVFQLEDRVRIANGYYCNNDLDRIVIPDVNNDKTMGFFGIVQRIRYKGHFIEGLYKDFDFEKDTILYITPEIGFNSDLNEFLDDGIDLNANDVVNYTVHGDDEGDRIFERSRSYNHNWFSVLNPQNHGVGFLIPDNIQSNIEDVSLNDEIILIQSTCEIFLSQSKYFYNRMYYEFLQVNRKFRKKCLLDALNNNINV